MSEEGDCKGCVGGRVGKARVKARGLPFEERLLAWWAVGVVQRARVSEEIRLVDRRDPRSCSEVDDCQRGASGYLRLGYVVDGSDNERWWGRGAPW